MDKMIKLKKAVLRIFLICAYSDQRFFVVLLEAKLMLLKVNIWLDTVFLRLLVWSTKTTTLSEFKSRKFEVIYVFKTLLHLVRVIRLHEQIKLGIRCIAVKLYPIPSNDTA